MLIKEDLIHHCKCIKQDVHAYLVDNVDAEVIDDVYMCIDIYFEKLLDKLDQKDQNECSDSVQEAY